MRKPEPRTLYVIRADVEAASTKTLPVSIPCYGVTPVDSVSILGDEPSTPIGYDGNRQWISAKLSILLEDGYSLFYSLEDMDTSDHIHTVLIGTGHENLFGNRTGVVEVIDSIDELILD